MVQRESCDFDETKSIFRFILITTDFDENNAMLCWKDHNTELSNDNKARCGDTVREVNLVTASRFLGHLWLVVEWSWTQNWDYFSTWKFLGDKNMR